MTPRISTLSQRFQALPIDYRIVPVHGGFALQYRMPVGGAIWVSVYDGYTVAGCLRAYEQYANGDEPSVDTCEVVS